MSGIAGMLDMDAVRKLSVTDRIDLIGMIWDTLADENADIPLTEVQEAGLSAASQITRRIRSPWFPGRR